MISPFVSDEIIILEPTGTAVYRQDGEAVQRQRSHSVAGGERTMANKDLHDWLAPHEANGETSCQVSPERADWQHYRSLSSQNGQSIVLFDVVAGLPKGVRALGNIGRRTCSWKRASPRGIYQGPAIQTSVDHDWAPIAVSVGPEPPPPPNASLTKSGRRSVEAAPCCVAISRKPCFALRLPHAGSRIVRAIVTAAREMRRDGEPVKLKRVRAHRSRIRKVNVCKGEER